MSQLQRLVLDIETTEILLSINNKGVDWPPFRCSLIIFRTFVVTCLDSMISLFNMSLVLRKPVFGVFDQVRYKPGCTAAEDG